MTVWFHDKFLLESSYLQVKLGLGLHKKTHGRGKAQTEKAKAGVKEGRGNEPGRNIRNQEAGSYKVKINRIQSLF